MQWEVVYKCCGIQSSGDVPEWHALSHSLHTPCASLRKGDLICLSANRLITMSCPYAAAISSLCRYFKLTVPAAEGQGHRESHIH